VDLQAKQAQFAIRIMRLSFLLFGILLIYIAFKVPVQSRAVPNRVFELVISLLALTNIPIGFFAPKFFSRSPSRGFRSTMVPAPVKQWFTGRVASLAFFNACNLFAFVLHSIGGRIWIVELLFGAGMISFLFWNPGNPPIAEQAG
jgi:hypothetical protein